VIYIISGTVLVVLALLCVDLAYDALKDRDEE